jgi:hypothetical protein
MLWVGGCSVLQRAPTADATGNQAPVSLRNFQVQSVDGHRAVLIRLSRTPSLVRDSSSTHPGRITVEAWGPTGDRDLPERNLPQADPQMTQVRVSRNDGQLKVVLDFAGEKPPAYRVHEMADWIMIRFTAPES